MNHHTLQGVFALLKRREILSFLALHVLEKVEFSWELEFVVEFNALIGFNIEDHPHQMDDENVGELVQTGGPDDAFFLAELALEVINCLLLNESGETLIQVLPLLHFQLQVVEVLDPVPLLRTLGALDGHDGFTPVYLVHQIAEMSVLQLVLDFTEHNPQELLGVFLDPHIDITLVRVAECLRTVIPSLAEFLEREHPLELVQHILFELLPFLLGNRDGVLILHSKNCVSELRSHVELLEHRVHVANTPQVVEPHIMVPD